MKKFIQASAGIGDLLELAAGKADENQPENCSARSRTSIIRLGLWPASRCALGAAFAFL
jgi:hypothetical protein